MPPLSAREGREGRVSPFRSLAARTTLETRAPALEGVQGNAPAAPGSAVSFAIGPGVSSLSATTPPSPGVAVEMCQEVAGPRFERNVSTGRAGRTRTEKECPAMTGTVTTPASSPYSKNQVGHQRSSGGSGEANQPRHGPTRDLLEIFEMGVSRNITHLRTEVKDELAASTEALRDELLAAIGQMQGVELLQEIRDKTAAIERGPAKVEFQPVIAEIQRGDTSIRDAMQGLDSQMNKSTARMHEGFREIRDELMEKQEQAERERRDWLGAQLLEVERKADERHEQVLRHLRDMAAGSTSGFAEVRDLQLRGMQSLDRLEASSKSVSEQLGVDFAAHLERLQPQLKELTEAQETQKEIAKGTAEEIQKVTQQALHIQNSLAPCFEMELQKHLGQNVIKVDQQPVLRLLSQAQQTLNEEFPSLFAEIGRIQQELHIDFATRVPTFTRDIAPSRSRTSRNLAAAAEQALAMIRTPSHPSIEVIDRQESNCLSIPGTVMGTTASMCATASGMHQPGGSCHGGGEKKWKRVRTFYTQTDAAGTEDGWCQTEKPLAMPPVKKGKARRRPGSTERTSMAGTARRESRMSITGMPKTTPSGKRSVKAVFGDSEGMKQRARAALIRPQYNVFDYYKETGISQRIARSGLFETVTLCVIFANAVWLAVDTDLNKAATWTDAEPIFIVMENAFCLYFCGELTIRFFAFQDKRRCLKDNWFVFDSALVALMIIETWIITLVVWFIGGSGSSSVGGLSVFRAARMVKMLRISRMLRLLRGVPELFILVKGMKAASRSVGIFFMMWLVIVYIYSLIFRTIAEGTIESEYFSSVPTAMNNLLLGGILPAHALFVNGVTDELWVFWPIAVSFVSLASVLLMNMLVGVLVEVVNAIASTEKEGIAVLSLATDLRAAMTMLGWSTEAAIITADLPKLIFEPDVAIILETAGVDVVSLSDMFSVLFEDPDAELSFEDLVEIILNLRDTNTARVKDVKQQLRAIKNFVKDTELELRSAIAEEVGGIQTEVKKNFRDLAQRDTDEISDDEGSVGGRSTSKPFSFFSDT